MKRREENNTRIEVSCFPYEPGGFVARRTVEVGRYLVHRGASVGNMNTYAQLSLVMDEEAVLRRPANLDLISCWKGESQSCQKFAK